MKIVHVAAAAPYNENWGYQENLLPKYQCKLGNEVSLIVLNYENSHDGVVEVPCARYMSDDGVEIIRQKRKRFINNFFTNMLNPMDIYDVLVEKTPDFIFFHGLCSTAILDVKKYKKKNNPKCVVVQDNHWDYQIGPVCTSFRGWVKRAIYRLIEKMVIDDIEKIYGVTPQRKKYAQEYFNLPVEKMDVLIMGADDEKINFSMREIIRNNIRDKYEVKPNEFLIVTGGKIDYKKNIHILMKACGNLNNVKLLVFGSVVEELKEEFEEICSKNNNIIYVGWISADSVYDYFFASDLVIFPGQHSVLWEQACAAKVPCVFKHYEGMEHVDNGGNSKLLDEISENALRQVINELIFTDEYSKMKKCAQSELTDIYLYSKIAEKSVECMKREYK